MHPVVLASHSHAINDGATVFAVVAGLVINIHNTFFLSFYIVFYKNRAKLLIPPIQIVVFHPALYEKVINKILVNLVRKVTLR